MFADYVAIYTTHHDKSKAATIVQKNLDRIHKWSEKWKLSI